MADYEIDAVRKAIAVLQVLAKAEGRLGVTALGRELGLGKTSVFRILQTLVEQGLVKRDAETRRYGLGPELVVLGQAASEAVDFREAARPVMAELSTATALSSYLNVGGMHEVVCLEHVPSMAGIKLYGRAGHTMPYHACPSGLVLLAYGPSERIDRVLSQPLKRYGKGTIVSRRALRAELRRVRAQGYALGVDDLEDGVTSVAAPICGVTGDVIGALGLAGFSHLLSDKLDLLVVQVEESAATMSTGRRRPAPALVAATGT